MLELDSRPENIEALEKEVRIQGHQIFVWNRTRVTSRVKLGCTVDIRIIGRVVPHSQAGGTVI